MKVEVLFFGLSRELAGTDSEIIVLKAGAVLADLFDALGLKHGPLLSTELGQPHIVLINGQNHNLLGGREASLKSGDTVAVLPITAGG